MPNTMIRPRDPGSTAKGHLLRSQPPHQASGVAGDNREGLDVAGDDRARADDCAVAHRHTGQHTTVEANPCRAADANRTRRAASLETTRRRAGNATHAV